MSVLPVGFGSSGGVDTVDIGHSLRFRGAQYIATTLTTAATSTYFILFKQAKLGAINPLFDTNIKINANDTITAFGLTTTAVKRDPTGWHWMHVSNNGLVVDGVNLGAVTTSAITNPRIGYDGTNYANMYGARICCVSGSSLAYTDFVTFNTTTNEWVVKTKSAIKALVDAGGSAGFMYEFDDATSLTTLGNDYSSKNNDGTLTGGFSLTAGTTYDHMLDVPGNSYATLNPLKLYSTTATNFADANLKSSVTPTAQAYGSMALPNGQKSVFECYVDTVNLARLGIKLGSDTTQFGGWMYLYSGAVRLNDVLQVTYASYTTADRIRFEVDLVNNTLEIFKNGTSQGTPLSIANSSDWFPQQQNNAAGTSIVVWGFGQAPLHTASSYRSAAGGYFADAPTTGFKALCQANLPDVAIKNPKLHFDIKTRTGTAATYSVTGIGFQPDLVWSKSRGRAVDHALYDSVRGVQKQLESNSTGAETTETTGLTAFNSDGYTGGALDQINGTTATNSFVDWLWKAGGAAVSNTAGSITSQVSANVEAGFSVVTYTGTGANATVGHGLGKAPKLVIAKRRDGTSQFVVYHVTTTASKYMYLNQTIAATTNTVIWQGVEPTSTVFSLGTGNDANASSGLEVAYCFTDIEGYSKAFSYTGNGSTDGVYVDLGFKPRWILLKCSSTTGNWVVLDTTRDTYNVVGEQLYLNLANAGSTVTTLDITSRGFKARIATDPNSAQTFIGFAIADVAGKYSLGR